MKLGLAMAVAFVAGVLADARFSTHRFVMTDEGVRLDTRTGEMVVVKSDGVEVIMPAK